MSVEWDGDIEEQKPNMQQETSGIARNTAYESLLMRQIEGRKAEEKRKAEEARVRAEKAQKALERSRQEAAERRAYELVASYLVRHFPDALRCGPDGAIMQRFVSYEVDKLSPETFNEFLCAEKRNSRCATILQWAGFGIASIGIMLAFISQSWWYVLGLPIGIGVGFGGGWYIFSPWRHYDKCKFTD